MIKLKNKIVKINSLPNGKNQKKSNILIITIIILILISIVLIYFITTKNTLNINTLTIDKIIGKKTFITECNTKDYIIIGKDKSFSLSITNENCETVYYEGNLKIKNNELIFNKNIKGILDSKNNKIINNNLFEEDNNE